MNTPGTPRVVVITGSTRGIGYGLAQSFLEEGCAVVINGRKQATVDEAAAQLSDEYDAARVLGAAADMSHPEQVQALWDAAAGHFNRVDIWINNAGIENRRGKLWSLSPGEIQQVIDVNLTGVMIACSIAIPRMAEQGGGHIYNMEGLGSQGRLAFNLTPYGTSKAGLAYLTKALAQETEDEGLPVQITALNPGMVVTDLLMNSITPEREENAKRIFNILADRVEVVAPWLVDRMLENLAKGKAERIAWLTPPKIFARFALAPFRKRDLFSDSEPAT